MTVRRSFYFIILAVFSLSMLALRPYQPGVPGFAEITFPSSGDNVDGIITIRGTADHPNFSSYDLEFSYDPNPTDTWFPITDSIQTPVQEDGLALWDTSNISTGSYQIRLSVHPEQGQTIVATVGGIYKGTEGETTHEIEGTSQDQVVEVDPVEAESSFAQPEDGTVPDEPISPTETLVRLLSIGAIAATAILTSFGLYTGLRPRVRDYVGLLRMRRLYRQQRRSDRRDETEL